MILGGIQKNSFIDYPGKISCVLFTSGCNFVCPYCHNPCLVRCNPAQKGEKEADVMAFLYKRREFLEGVVVSGGEPTLSPDLLPFCEKIKKMGYSLKLDTNGSRPRVLDLLIREGLVDYIAMDIKTLPELYSDFIKKDFDERRLFTSIQLIMESGKDYEFRSTCVKPMVDAEIIKEISNLIKGARLYALQKFVPTDVLCPDFFNDSGSGYNEDDLFHFKSIAGQSVVRCIVRS